MGTNYMCTRSDDALDALCKHFYDLGRLNGLVEVASAETPDGPSEAASVADVADEIAS